MRKALLFQAFLLMVCAGLAAAPTEDTTPYVRGDGEVRQGAWDKLVKQRPLLNWETLRGYRLFFHPDDPESLRRWVGIGVDKSGGDLTGVWALIRPYNEKSPRETWLRVEGRYSHYRDYAALEWDGLYRGYEFPDSRYRFDIQARYGRRKHEWKVVAVKSKDHPRFHKVGEEKIGSNPLKWDSDTGEYLPQRPEVFLSQAAGRRVPLLARVHLPELDDDFRIDGILMQARRLEGGTDLTPIDSDTQQWQCLCSQLIPSDSPARKKLKTVRCYWDLDSDPERAQGLWELRVSLFHYINHKYQSGPCDMPVLDEDRVWVKVRR